MKLKYNMEDLKDIKKLDYSKRFLKYPDMFLGKNCEVKINGDDFFRADSFIICCKKKVLPRRIYIYGKKGRDYDSDNLYLNYWLKVFLRTVEKGNLFKQNFEKSDSKIELCIGLPYKFRRDAFRRTWTRKNIIEFLSCLFDTYIEEAEYKQEDFFEQLVA